MKINHDSNKKYFDEYRVYQIDVVYPSLYWGPQNISTNLIKAMNFWLICRRNVRMNMGPQQFVFELEGTKSE